MSFEQLKEKIVGNVVPVPGQFNDDLSLNLQAYRAHVSFLMEAGIKVFYLASSASEFNQMRQQERVQVTRVIAETINDDCFLISQALGDQWIDDQIEEARMLMDNGANAIVVAPKPIREGAMFFNSFYSRDSYKPERHDDYFFSYMEQVARQSDAPLVYHSRPMKNGRGLSLDLLDRITDIDNVIGMKEHVKDPLTLHMVYQRLGKKVSCFDGHGKTVQIYSRRSGARARHTCWAWFDPQRDMLFEKYLGQDDLSRAVDVIYSEWPIAEAICQSGFQGYKYIMKRMGLASGPCRIPGEELNRHHEELLDNALRMMGFLE